MHIIDKLIDSSQFSSSSCTLFMKKWGRVSPSLSFCFYALESVAVSIDDIFMFR